MKLLPESNYLNEYLKNTDIIDFTNKNIMSFADSLMKESRGKTEFTVKAFEFVRDRIPHILDCHGNNVVCRASDVLKTGYGFCYAKSHLLAAILRCKGVPAGFCYQKLWFSVSLFPKLVLHGLNAVYLEKEEKWIRIDARGNKPGVNAQFSIGKEKLAFPVRKLLGEKDYPLIYANPGSKVIELLMKYYNVKEMINNLPGEL